MGSQRKPDDRTNLYGRAGQKFGSLPDISRIDADGCKAELAGLLAELCNLAAGRLGLKQSVINVLGDVSGDGSSADFVADATRTHAEKIANRRRILFRTMPAAIRPAA